MLESVKSVGDRVKVPPLGVGSVEVHGTVLAVDERIPGVFFYKVEWDDGEYPDEWWGVNDLTEPTE